MLGTAETEILVNLMASSRLRKKEKSQFRKCTKLDCRRIGLDEWKEGMLQVFCVPGRTGI